MKNLFQRNGFWYARKHVPARLRPAFGGKREVWRSLATQDRREAERRFHAAMAAFNREIEAAERVLDAEAREAELMDSPRIDDALDRFARTARSMHLPVPTFAPRPQTAADREFVEMALKLGQAHPRPATRAEAIDLIDRALAYLEGEREHDVHLAWGADEDGEPHWVVPVRYLDGLKEWIDGQFDATRRTLKAIRLEFEAEGSGASEAAPGGGVPACDATSPGGGRLRDLQAVWEARRRPARSSRHDMHTAVARFEKIAGPLAYRDIGAEHLRRFKADLIGDGRIKTATKQKRWAMVRALLSVAKEDGLVAEDPFDTVKLGQLPDDSESREDLTKSDLVSLFGALEGDEWWLVRLALYTGARLGELCPLTMADLIDREGVAYIAIRDDEAGRSVKTRNSVRQVPVHRQLIADGFLAWAKGRPSDNLFPWKSSVASKRLLRRFRDAGLGGGKVVHSLRHTFISAAISAARMVMEEEWRDKLSGHRSQRVGRAYGDYADLKAKIDRVAFGLETA